MSDMRRSNSQLTWPDLDDDDDELILVFPSGIYSRIGSSSTLPTTVMTSNSVEQQPILLRPRHASSSMLLSFSNNENNENHVTNSTDSTADISMTNGTNFRSSPSCWMSPNIWSTLRNHQQRGNKNVGVTTTSTPMTTSRMYRTPLSPMNHGQRNQHCFQYNKSQYLNPPLSQAHCNSNPIIRRNDHHLQNRYNTSAVRSPDKHRLTFHVYQLYLHHSLDWKTLIMIRRIVLIVSLMKTRCRWNRYQHQVQMVLQVVLL